MRIYETKTCDKCMKYTHHIDYPTCKWCAGMTKCRECGKNVHHKKYPTCFECKAKH